MVTDELISMLTAGLSAEDAARVKMAIEREGVKTQVQALKTLKEMEEVQARANKAAEYETLLDGVDANGNPQGYRAWYNTFGKTVHDNDAFMQELKKKYGADAAQKILNGTLVLNGQPAPSRVSLMVISSSPVSVRWKT